ncbi:hypothetical protein [Methylobacterium isbiliense]|jgi:hypothetical protein|uniref:Ribosome modulation factor n=1 Tax=Methylobacterium isbiliense TaxID=315478 RepID=A0ABQ4S8K5_9HYPH|nr:hypothetical protein [Methylobacterium isbiliense]MDN3622948.1 hypothetical protein [Methylobacterium isbiliense]GJD98818.1 hypothetical protein GMJLKIPL_0731 [Methylobacterium isbiliense]
MAYFVVSQTIFEEGRAAKAAGRPHTDDPYRAGSQDSADWLAGYTADEAGADGEETGPAGTVTGSGARRH